MSGAANVRTCRAACIPALASIALVEAASAHHGFGSFDRSREIEITGTITGVDFVNPHSWVYLDVVGDDGLAAAWRCELRAATVLRRSGWSADMFVTGERLTINGAPDRNDPHSCYLSTAIFADGTRADRYGQLHRGEPPATAAVAEGRPARLPNGQPNISGDFATEQLVMSDPRGRAGDLVPLSRAAQSDADRIIPQDEWAGNSTNVSAGADEPENFRQYRTRPVELTEAGQRAADTYGMFTVDDPRMRCETTSILFDWVYDGAVNRITQTDDTVVLEYGQFGFTRTVHLDADEHPDDVTPSRSGHSIGRWDGDILVVDTIGFEPGVLSPPVMHSDRLHVVERFSLDTQTMLLRREYAAMDPVNWGGEYRGTDYVGPADVPYSPDPCEWEHTFINYAEQQKP
jgi:hypothetical protein